MKAKILITVLAAMTLPFASSWANQPAEPQWNGQQVSTMAVGEQAFDSASGGSSADTAPPQ